MNQLSNKNQDLAFLPNTEILRLEISGSCVKIAEQMDESPTRSTPLTFHELQLSDWHLLAPLLEQEDSPATLGCFGTLFLWGNAYGLSCARLGNRLLFRYSDEDEIAFAYPSGVGSLRPAIEWMRQFSQQYTQPLTLYGLTEIQKARLEQEYPNGFLFEENRDYADYLYTIDALADLPGKKLQSKRNHCNRFLREHPNWRFEPLTAHHFDACMQLLEQWESFHAQGTAMQVQTAEKSAIRASFDAFVELQLCGGALFVEERLVAFTLGERTGGNSFDVHFEKADSTVHGAYQMINREFARFLRHTHPNLHTINREEDMGLEHLRKAKLSYHPAMLLTKYTARWVD